LKENIMNLTNSKQWLPVILAAILYLIFACIFGFACVFGLIGERVSDKPEPKTSALEQRVQRLEERLDALQSITHGMIGRERGGR
jgi:hypothetical protein